MVPGMSLISSLKIGVSSRISFILPNTLSFSSSESDLTMIVTKQFSLHVFKSNRSNSSSVVASERARRLSSGCAPAPLSSGRIFSARISMRSRSTERKFEMRGLNASIVKFRKTPSKVAWLW